MAKRIFNVQLTPHFSLDELLTLDKHPNNVPGMQAVVNLTYGAINILEPARLAVGVPIKINSGFRNFELNRQVGGVSNSQHLEGCAVDITCDPLYFNTLVNVLMRNSKVDQLLTAKTWLHVSWCPFGKPRQDVRLNYYN